MDFEIINGITQIEIIAVGSSIREIGRLRKLYGLARWSKLKGVTWVEYADGTICLAEIHWHEAQGTGKKEMKVKRTLECNE